MSEENKDLHQILNDLEQLCAKLRPHWLYEDLTQNKRASTLCETNQKMIEATNLLEYVLGVVGNTD